MLLHLATAGLTYLVHNASLAQYHHGIYHGRDLIISDTVLCDAGGGGCSQECDWAAGRACQAHCGRGFFVCRRPPHSSRGRQNKSHPQAVPQATWSAQQAALVGDLSKLHRHRMGEVPLFECLQKSAALASQASHQCHPMPTFPDSTTHLAIKVFTA